MLVCLEKQCSGSCLIFFAVKNCSLRRSSAVAKFSYNSNNSSGRITMLCTKNLSTRFGSFFFFHYFLLQICDASYNLRQNQSLVDGQTLVSAGENFTLGFFSPVSLQNRYVGIWYSKIHVRTVIWVANRENPVADPSGIFKIVKDGNLEVLDGNGSSVWSSNASVAVKNPTAELLDSGNLVLSDGSSGNVIWQSFDHPTDSYLPGMRLGLNRKTGKSWHCTSWMNPENPSSGDYSFRGDIEGIVQWSFQGIINEGSTRRWRSGPWDGRTFVGIPIMETKYHYGFDLINDNKNGDIYATYSTSAFSSEIVNYVVNSSGFLNYRHWDKESNLWLIEEIYPADQCDTYGHCGANGYCSHDLAAVCNCLPGFEPKSYPDSALRNWSDGCVRRIPLACENNSSSKTSGEGDGFLRLTTMKIPDRSIWIPAANDKDCAAECRKSCSCIAFVHASGLGCMIWDGELVDLRKFSKGGLDLYLRLAASEFDRQRRVKVLVIVIVTPMLVMMMGACACSLWMRKARTRESKSKEEGEELFLLNLDTNALNILDAKSHGNIDGKGKMSPLLDLSIVTIATDNFSTANKLGEGGFGPVYKGMLPNGKEIAVKRLSRSSCQGLEEFRNEVILISKLQHRNLVCLLGYCVKGEEKLLVYEYMPNKSLDAFLFDQTKRRLLDWRTRFNIVEGIARGLLYLHRDSRLRIIHRDLKPSNILLDDQMNPKISDFGMARIFGGNQTQANTNRVVGTYGYMSPEYAMKGLFSKKSDVFSFGIILLEIVSGKRNTSFYHHQHFLNLLGYAWILWNENNGLEFVDPLLDNSFQTEQVLKCIHLALLCVQDDATNRPTMSSVLSMLASDATILSTPKQPAFFMHTCPTETRSSMDNPENVSINDLTISLAKER